MRTIMTLDLPEAYIEVEDAEEIAARVVDSAAWTAATDDQQTAALIQASDEIDTLLAGRWEKENMKRLILILMVVVALFLVASCSATYNETWRGPAGKATPVSNPRPSDLSVYAGGEEFIPVGYYTWTDVHRNNHRELVYVKRPQAKGGAK
jgi:hypothetical protein